MIALITLWLAADVIILAVGLLAIAIIKPHCPEWWRRHIVDEEYTDENTR